MVRTLAGFEHVGMARGKREVCSAVLEDEAAVTGNDAGAEAVIDAVDEGDSISVGV